MSEKQLYLGPDEGDDVTFRCNPSSRHKFFVMEIFDQDLKVLTYCEDEARRLHQFLSFALNERGKDLVTTVRQAHKELAQLRAERYRLREALRLRTADEWHDECGCVLWWGDREEAHQSSPWYVGSPLDDDPHGCVYSSNAVWLPIPCALEGEG